jgi:hypothetical protein
MTSSRALPIIILLAMAVQPHRVQAESRLPQSGSYEITVRLELPHLERWGVDRTKTICLPTSGERDDIPVPNPFAKCTAANLVTDGLSSNTTLFALAAEQPRVTPLICSQPTHSLAVSRW